MELTPREKDKLLIFTAGLVAERRKAWDAAGDNKVEYKSPKGRGVVFKLKTAPDIASGILDQYELGPYNLLILGEPSRWQGEMGAILGSSGIVQKITMRSPCSA